MRIIKNLLFRICSALTRWSKPTACIHCGDTDSKIKPNGECVRCYQCNWLRAKKLKHEIGTEPRATGKNKCAVTGCTRKSKSHGFCGKHYNIWRYFGHPLGKGHGILKSAPDGKNIADYGICGEPGCSRPISIKGKCGKHAWAIIYRNKQPVLLEKKSENTEDKEKDELKFEIHTGTEE